MEVKENKELDYGNRFYIQKQLQKGTSIRQIARDLGFAHSTISKEIKKGWWHTYRNGQYVEEYRAKYAQAMHESARRRCGRKKKYLDEIKLLLALEKLMRDGYSPYAALMILKTRMPNAGIATKTVYNYVRAGILSETYLRYGLIGMRRRNRKKKEDFNKRNKIAHPGGESIEARPKSVLSREEFGHWEGDLVVSKRGSHACLLTLVERKTRFLIVLWCRDKSAKSVIEALDLFEETSDLDFEAVFKSVTWDNGKEFVDGYDLKRSVYPGRRGKDGEGGRFAKVYYAHPYCSGERGSNENCNRMIRVMYPKGSSFDGVTNQDIWNLTDFINNYPRLILGGQSAQQHFNAELANI